MASAKGNVDSCARVYLQADVDTLLAAAVADMKTTMRETLGCELARTAEATASACKIATDALVSKLQRQHENQ